MVRLRGMLIDYELRQFNMSDARAARRLVFYILSQDRDTALRDALAVVSAYDLPEDTAYFFRIKQLVGKNRVRRFLFNKNRVRRFLFIYFHA